MDFISLLLAVPLIIVSLFLIYVRVLQFKYRYAESVPFAGLSKYPLFINDWKLLRASPEGKFDIIKDTFSQHDRLFKVWLGPRLAFGTCHPEVVQAILTHPECVEKPFFYRFTRLDHGLLVGRGMYMGHSIRRVHNTYNRPSRICLLAPLWKRQRKHLNSTFNLRILTSFVPIFEKCCQQMVADLKPHENGEAFDVLQYTTRCTLSMVLQTSIGAQCLPVEESDILVKHIKRFISITTNRVLNLHQYWEPAYRLTKHYKMESESQTFCESVTGKILRRKRAQLNGQSNSEDDIEGNKPRIFLDQLLNMSKLLNEKEIIHNTFTMIAAGNDTSGQLMAYACLFLGMYPHIQEKVYAEIMDHIPPSTAQLDDHISVDQLKSLTYTEMFLNECLRLCPIGPTIARLNMAPIVLEGIKIPAGHFLFISFFALHRRKDIWGPDADLFDPDRFSPERSKGRHPYAFLPFSGGSRNCIGWRYAMMSLKMMMVYLLRQYRLKTDIRISDFRFKFDMVLVLAFEHWVKIERRATRDEP